MIRLEPRLALALVALVLGLAGCGDEGGQTDSGGGGALGGKAQVETLARAPLDAQPPKKAAWSAWRVDLKPGERLEHEHPFSTVFAEDGEHTLTIGSEQKTIEADGGAIVSAGQRHVHEAGDGPATFWDVLLAGPGAELPGARGAERVFETEPLQDIPDRAEVAFLDVVLPPGGQTTAHTHPGPETIYVMRGPFDYQNAIEGSSTVDEGAVKSIPPDTTVQKRNPGDDRPRFLSWFVVDPSQEFAPTTEFDSGN